MAAHQPGGATAVTSHRADDPPQGAGRSWAPLILLCVAEFMVILDVTVVNVALPSIGRSLRFAAADLQWVVTAYVLLSGGLVLLGGRAADLIGGRRVFLAGLGLFTAASLASGLAPSAGALIAARAGQGLGAALLTPAALAVIVATYSGRQRAAALSAWAALASGGAAAGLLAGGMLTTWLGWRSVFLINVPVGIAAGALSPRLVPRLRPSADTGRRLDLPGAVLAAAGLVTLVYALAGAPSHGWGSARTLVLLAGAAVLLATFAITERAVRRPLVPPDSWRIRSLRAGMAVMLGATGLLVGTFFLNSLYLQDVLGTSALRTGLEFLPVMLAVGLGSHAASRLLTSTGSRVIAVAGLAMMAGGALLLSAAGQHAGYLTGLLPGLLVTGIGTGLAFPAASITAMSEIRPERAGLASGMMTGAHEVGAALGVAVFSALATAQAMAGGGFAAGYRHGFAVAAAAAAGLALLALVIVPAVRPAPGMKARVH